MNGRSANRGGLFLYWCQTGKKKERAVRIQRSQTGKFGQNSAGTRRVDPAGFTCVTLAGVTAVDAVALLSLAVLTG